MTSIFMKSRYYSQNLKTIFDIFMLHLAITSPSLFQGTVNRVILYQDNTGKGDKHKSAPLY